MRLFFHAVALVAFAAPALLAHRADAQTCQAPAIWSPGLTAFCANEPARADEVNGNFSKLVELVQTMTAPLAQTLSADGGIAVGTVTANSLKTSVIRVVPTNSAVINTGAFTATDLTAPFTVPPN